MLQVTLSRLRTRLALLAIAGSAVLSASSARADDISFVDVFNNISYEQTGNGNSLTFNGAFFSAEINSTTANVYSSATVTSPGGSATSLSQSTPAVYGFQTGLLPSVAAMNATYPKGTYTFTGLNSSGTDTATLNYTADDYSQTNPYLTGTSYSSLQDMNAAQELTLGLSTFTPGGSADETDAFIFLTIFDETTGTTAFNDDFLSASTTSIILPGGTLAAGDSYEYEIDYSDRDTVTGTGGQFAPELGFDVRTDGTFATAPASVTPEPDSFALLATSLVGLTGCVRRRFV